jgi:hypothetical protein
MGVVGQPLRQGGVCGPFAAGGPDDHCRALAHRGYPLKMDPFRGFLASRSLLILLGVSFAFALAVSSGLANAAAGAEPVPAPGGFECFLDAEANMTTLEHSLQPVGGATVDQGSPVLFSGRSESALSFQIASSTAVPENPAIDSGAGAEEPPTGPGELPTYAFTSGVASATARTVYWTASFSSSGLEGCSGEPEHTYRSAPRALVVTGPPTPPTPPTEEDPRCRVPGLRGDSLHRARRQLASAGCHLGRISVPGPHRKGRLVVRQQHPRPGVEVPTWRQVSIALGPARR